MPPKKLDGFDGNWHTGAQFVTMRGTGAITVGQAVCIDTSDTTFGRGNSVQVADDNGAGDIAAESLGLLCGVADETITVAGDIRIQTRGIRTLVWVAATVAMGERLIASDVAGRLQDSNQETADANRNITTVAVALTAAVDDGLGAANSITATVLLLDPLGLASD